MIRKKGFRLSLLLLSTAALCHFDSRPGAYAQSVQPLISEYTGHAEGWFEVTNSSLAPEVIVIEPKSFDIQPDGTGRFRPLDPEIQLELSVTSMRLEPHQTARVFYKATADKMPAWLCIYSSFCRRRERKGLTFA